MTIEYLDLADYIGIASEVTGLDGVIVTKVANLDAVLVVRLAKNHPLPDGNKRVAWT